MYTQLKKLVYEANMLLPKYNLVKFTWGNVSEVDWDKGVMAIKPSGVEYEALSPELMVVIDIHSGKILEGDLNPSSDTDTHLEIYKAYNDIKGIVHTHSPWATIFSQAGMPIACFGTTHADYFYGEIPISRKMTASEIALQYEKNTGKLIIETFKEKEISPINIPSVLVYSHGPFSFGTSAKDAVHNAVVLEEAANMAWHTRVLNPNINHMQKELLDKHFLRKHGDSAYYGQKNEV